MSKKWYVIQAYSGYENTVRLRLEDRIKQKGMDDFFGQILIPKESVQEPKAGGGKRTRARNFYPGYIFVEMDLNEHTWHLVKDTKNVSGFVGGHHQTARLTPFASRSPTARRSPSRASCSRPVIMSA
jgi:transcriptional antiterminator NusG